MSKVIVALVIAIIAVCLPEVSLAQEDGLTVAGRVIDDTDAGAGLGGIEISLHGYSGNNLTGTMTSLTDEAGAFRFEGVAAGQAYLIAAEYRGVSYYQPVTFEPGATEAFVEVHVVEVTQSDAAITAEAMHVIIEFDGGSPNITEIFRMVNTADRTFTRGEGSLVFTLPPGAVGLDVPTGLIEDYQLREDGTLLYLPPFPPGEAELLFSYMLPAAEKGDYSLSFEADYPVVNLEVLISGENIEVGSADLAPADPVTTGTGQLFLHYRGSELGRGDSFSLTIVQASAGGGGYTWVIYALAALVVIVVALAMLRRRRRLRA